MDRKSSRIVIRSFVMIALVTTALAPNIRDREINPRAQDVTSQSPAVAPPIVLAQGRCFNGRCY
jgi:hypothetical protein